MHRHSERRAAVAAADRVVTGDAPTTRRANVLDADAIANLTVERLVALAPPLADRSFRLRVGGETVLARGDPTVADTDGDGLDDGAEIQIHGTDPTATDTDGDGLGDAAEVELGTDPTVADTDRDGLDDGAEVNTHETDPTDPDSDDDGLGDGAEVTEHGTNPTRADTDGDGLDDAMEVHVYGTDPTSDDTDGDGLDDGREVREEHTDPTVADTDGDGFDDGQELARGTDPTVADTDGDGLDDGAEVNRFDTDPTDPDSDGDGVGDAQEVDRGLLPPGTLVPLVVVVGVAAVGAALASRRVRRPLVAAVPDPVRERVVASRQYRRVADSRIAIGVGAGVERARNRVHGVVDRVEVVDPFEPIVDDTGETASTDAAGGAGQAGHRSTNGDGAPVPNPEAAVTDEERVLAIVEASGGRIRQAELVERTDWSKSKVSRVLSRMAEEGTVSKITIGRGNVVSLPGEEPTGTGAADEG